jgi:hypothetical protein
MFLFVVNGERAIVTLMQPRHERNSGGTNRYCVPEDLSDASNPILDNCPSKSTCVPNYGTPTIGRCTIYTYPETYVSALFDYESETILEAETQIDAVGNSLECNIVDASGTAAGAGTGYEEYRCIEHAVTLSEVPDTSLYTACTVTFYDGIWSKMSLGKVGSVPHDSGSASAVQVAGNTVFNKKNGTDDVTCHFVMKNNLFVGYTYASVRFQKDPLKLSGSDRSETIVKVPILFQRGSVSLSGLVDSTPRLPDPSLEAVHSDIGYAATGYTGFGTYSGSSSDKGTVQLPYDFLVLDKRYLIAEQTGVETLDPMVGDFSLIKSGIEIHTDYKGYYAANDNDFLRENVAATTINFAAYQTGDCTLHGRNAGEAMSSDGCAGFFDQFYSQYRLTGNYEFKYGGMPHFKKSYVRCELCENALVIKGFKRSGVFEMDVTVPIDVNNLISGCDSACIDLPNIFATPVTSRFDGALLLPNCNGTGYHCGEVGVYDPRFDDGYALSEFMTPILSGTTGYDDLDSKFNFLGDKRLVVTGNDKSVVDTSTTGLEINSVCISRGTGSVYTMESDLLSFAQKLFFDECKIKVLQQAFAKVSYVSLFKTIAEYDLCKADGTTSCSSAVYSKIVEIDRRQVIVGNTELSLIRRKVASVVKAGAVITMQISKYTEIDGQILYFQIVGTDTMIGYDRTSTPCTERNILDGNTCYGELNSEESNFESDPTNGKKKWHTIRSSPACSGYMDIQLRDMNDTFAVYDVRLPCSRTTDATSDSISLAYDFSLEYDLSTNLLAVGGTYLSDMLSNPAVDFDSVAMSALGLSQEISASVAYGQCVNHGGGHDTISYVNSDGVLRSSMGCDASSAYTGGFEDLGTPNNTFVSTEMNLTQWRECAYSTSDDVDAYTIVSSIAMLYNRTLRYERVGSVSSGTIVSSNQFCDDKLFTTTITRDSSAIVSVSSLRAPQLERAVRVTGITWELCGTNKYQLVVEMKSDEKYFLQDDTYWYSSPLNDAMKSINSNREDSDALTIDKGTMGSTSTTNTFKLLSACVDVLQADCDAISEVQTDPSSTSGSAYAQLSHTLTDIVIRGLFNSVNVDSDVRIETSYLHCPIGEHNTPAGFVRSAATFSCDETLETTVSTTIADRSDCSEAYTTGFGTARVDLYIEDSVTSLVTADGKARALNNGWQIRTVDTFIERYEVNFDLSAGALISNDQLCKCGSQTTPYSLETAERCLTFADAGNGLTDSIYGLTPFSTLTCGGGTDQSNSTYNEVRFNFLPITDAMNDLYVIKFVVLAENDYLDARRHLRHSLTLRAIGGQYTVSTGGLKIIAASTSTSDASTSDTPANDAGGESEPQPSEPSEPSGESSGEPSEEPESGSSMKWWGMSLIIIAVVGVVTMVIYMFLEYSKRKGYTNVDQFEESVGEGVRDRRFSKLVY